MNARNYQRGEDRHNAKLDESAVLEIRRLGPTTKNIALAAQFGVCESSIEHVLALRTWKHVKASIKKDNDDRKEWYRGLVSGDAVTREELP